MNNATPLVDFQWVPQPEAERLVHELVDAFVLRSPQATRLRERLLRDAAVRLVDVVDHVRIAPTGDMESRLIAAGFQLQSEPGAGGAVFRQEDGIFPPVILDPGAEAAHLAIKVESVTDFESVWLTGATVSGRPLEPVRSARIARDDGLDLWVIERHGYRGFDFDRPSPPATAILLHADHFRRRPRRVSSDGSFPTIAQNFAAVRHLAQRAADDLGIDYACDLFFAAERDYWQRRNRAAAAQKARQDRLGLGWANHDHHTYRSSRAHFAELIGLFEQLGFHCRERFYAGREAGWGAQVLEQPHAGVVIFADVDLSPDELLSDFAHEPLPDRHELGTVGLWCALHGESLLEAGMHHLECQFDFDGLKQQLESEASVTTMPPFTNFSYLRQAFTAGERWPVDPQRLEKLLSEKRITPQQAEAFRREGAIGSHLEVLERNAGFKGFNQTGVSQIIAATDPRKHLEGAAG
jgi:hypothetical protein